MKHFPAMDIAAAAILTVTLATAALSQTAPAAVSAFTLGFDDLMTMLIQPRHMKLYYAGTAKNWELAAAEARELRSSFVRITQAVPRYQGNDVDLSVRNFIAPRMDAIDKAIAGANSAQFTAAYKELNTGCNECHAYMEHGFFVIQSPPAAAADSEYSDQDFRPIP